MDNRPALQENVRNTKKRRYLRSNERSIVSNVITACVKEATQKELLVNINSPNQRAAVYANVSLATIGRIRKERENKPHGLLESPRRKTDNLGRKPIVIDSFTKSVIRQTMEDFYINQKIVPTLRKLLNAVKQKIHFPWQKDVLHKTLREMGFTWKRSVSKRKILVERTDIIDWRCKYLIQVRKLRELGRKFFYIDETWVDNNITYRKCWQGPGVEGIMDNVSGSNRIIVVNIGSKDGFLPNAQLVYKAGCATGDYHGQMNYENFSNWISNKVIPNLPPNCVIVMDNASYHNKEHNKAPTRSSNKSEMIEWLLKNKVEAELTMRKTKLFDLIKQHKPEDKVFEINKILEAHGHTVLRLPPYNCDLNPIEMAWAKLKNFVRGRNILGDICMTKLLQLVKEGFETISQDDWSAYCLHVEKLEREYWVKDGVMEDIIDAIVINLESDDDEDDDDDDSNDSDNVDDDL
ncbi:uncharacterized protein LOC126176676 [Schistocerca cancellata]|uniref:uncharacterized protein LOC126176676 n=2 Tax=Schistocerca TaxID=7008 RepID=UPI002118BF01|nr:uncharacterized protein LOC126176676 [Schistocerca cancellata]